MAAGGKPFLQEGSCFERNFDRCIIQASPLFAVVLTSEGKVRMMNERMLLALGYTAAEVVGADYIKVFVPPFERKKVARVFAEITKLNKFTYNENHVLARDGKLILVEWHGRPVFKQDGKVDFFFGMGIDITRRRQAEEALRRSEAKFKAAFEGIHDAVIIFTQEGKFIDCNGRALELFGLSSKVEFLAWRPGDFSPPFQPDGRRSLTAAREQIKRSFVKKYNKFEWLHQRKNGERFHAEVIHTVYRLGEELVLQASIRDITERKAYESKLQYLSLHDQLTGLYNRAFFVEEMRRLSGSREYPITVICADMDCLKLINDSMGHAKGDELIAACGEILRRSTRGSDILARLGGDEFAVLLPKTDRATGEAIAARINDRITAHNREQPGLFMSLSLGIAVAESKDFSLEDTYKKADDLMYRKKFSRRRAVRKKIFDSFISALAGKDHFAKGHAERLAALCRLMGAKLKLPSDRLAEMLLLARVHDLGKIAIPDNILFKAAPFSREEREILQQHPEKGYSIASAHPDLAPVAELILRHHERWDGSGYPLGLKGEEIPLECRIFALADTYDALTSNRPCRPAWGKEQALEYIRKQSSKKYEPALVELFVTELEKCSDF